MRVRNKTKSMQQKTMEILYTFKTPLLYLITVNIVSCNNIVNVFHKKGKAQKVRNSSNTDDFLPLNYWHQLLQHINT